MSDRESDTGYYTRSFCSNGGSKQSPFSLTVEVLPSNNSKNGSLCQGCIN